MGFGKSDEDVATGIEMVSGFLDGELDEGACEHLLQAVHRDQGVGQRLVRYALIREVVREHDWQPSTYLTPRPIAARLGLGAWLRTLGRSGGRPPVWAWGLATLVLCVVGAVLFLAPARHPGGMQEAVGYSGAGAAWFLHAGQNRPQYGQVRETAWKVASPRIRHELEAYWMIHEASLAGSQMMGYPHVAAYSEIALQRKAGWHYRHYRH